MAFYSIDYESPFSKVFCEERPFNPFLGIDKYALKSYVETIFRLDPEDDNY